MTTLVSTLNTVFTPNTGMFAVQVTGAGAARLDRRNTSSSVWASVGVITTGQALVVDNPVAATDYRFVGVSDTPTVQADQ